MIKKYRFSLRLLVCVFLLAGSGAFGAESTVPDPFQRFDANSKLTIDYRDLDSFLDALVLNTGRSTREKARSSHAKTGTLMKAKVNRYTINEGNRFYYEVFVDNPQNRQTLRKIRNRLENIPATVPLEKFSRDEQLAYWMNLYNTTILDEIVNVYPEHDLENLLVGENSILAKKTLMVAGVPLSLDDIQFTILRQNYDNNPLIIYGLYQGNIGGPSIRKSAYTGKYVYADLIENALEFINSNRGTFIKNNRTFRVSSLYERNAAFFDDFDADLKAHLAQYLEGKERIALQAASTIKPDIDDWTVTDLYGSQREFGGSLASNNAALIGAASGGGDPSRFSAKSTAASRYSTEVVQRLNELNRKREEERKGNVSVEELGEAPAQADNSDQDPNGGN